MRHKDQIILTEKVREALARQISKQHTGDRGYIPAITMDPALEQEIADGLEHTERGLSIAIPPEKIEAFYDSLTRAMERAAAGGTSGRPPLFTRDPSPRSGD